MKYFQMFEKVTVKCCVVNVLCCSWSRSHPCRASLCDLANNDCVHPAAVSLSKHRETWEGKVR